MDADAVERLKRVWTDRLVRVRVSGPRLERFGGLTGRVVTVNHNGKVLVDFGDGPWFDLDPTDLEPVDRAGG